MTTNPIHICPRCGNNILSETTLDCWSSASHLPFDSLLKIKSLFNNNCLCEKCLTELSEKDIISPQKNTLKRNESLKLKKIIEDIFIRKDSFVSFPLKVFMLEAKLPSSSAVQLLISIPKRNFKNATDRNLLKRRIKEAYRKHKHRLHKILDDNNKQLAIAILYIHKDFATYEKIEKEVILSLQKIENKYLLKKEE